MLWMFWGIPSLKIFFALQLNSAATVMHVEVQDYMLFCLAKVTYLTSNATMVGVLGDWWIVYSSSSRITALGLSTSFASCYSVDRLEMTCKTALVFSWSVSQGVCCDTRHVGDSQKKCEIHIFERFLLCWLCPHTMIVNQLWWRWLILFLPLLWGTYTGCGLAALNTSNFDPHIRWI